MCGCGKVSLSSDGLVMCAVCPKLTRRSATAASPATCSVDGRPVLIYQGRTAVSTRPCPIGRHPDENNIVRWLGIRWYGVPMPVRLWLRYRPFGKRLRRKVSGCGCVVVLKDLWVKLTGNVGTNTV